MDQGLTTPDPERTGVHPLSRQQLTQAEGSGTFWHRTRSRIAVREVQKVGARSCVDVGAGAGTLGEYVRRRRPDVGYAFVEPDPLLAASLRSRFGAENEVGVDDDMARFDLVAMMDVLEHVEDDRTFLADVGERTRGGTRFVVTVPAMPSLYSAWDDAMGHYRRYTRRSLRAVVPASLEVRNVSYLFPELIPAAALRRLRHPLTTDINPEFPDLPDVMDRSLEVLCRLSASLRRIWPVGSSLLLIADRR